MKAEYIDHLGTDLTVVNAARVSFDKQSWWANEEEWLSFDADLELNEKDKKLIKYLARENHFTPFTHCVITLRETVPIFVARQRFKHTVGFTYNETSRRYVDDAPEFYVPDEWRGKPKNAKQGSSDEVIDRIYYKLLEPQYQKDPEWVEFSQGIKEAYQRQMDNALQLYTRMIDSGVAPEQARMVLPQSMYTSYYTTGSLSAFARAYNLRSEGSAQKEIQELAIMWANIIEPLFPESWKALTND